MQTQTISQAPPSRKAKSVDAAPAPAPSTIAVCPSPRITSPPADAPPRNLASIPVFSSRELKVGAETHPLEAQASRASRHAASPQIRPLQLSSAYLDGQEPIAPASVHRALSISGKPLSSPLRAQMEHHFGHSLAQVRLHSGDTARRSATELGARAYTVGPQIVFGEEGFAPEAPANRSLLTHELAHVLQQRAGATLLQRSPSPDKKYANSISAAHYRGRVMAQRITRHGLLSKEARAKIDEELQYFTEGPAKDAYLHEIKPALASVNPIEMPLDFVNLMHGKPKRPVGLLESFKMPGQFDDDQVYAPMRERERQEQQEKDAARKSKLDQLKALSSDWRPEDQAAALQQLDTILQANLNPDSRGVSDKDSALLHARLDKELHDVDAARLADCAAGKVSAREKQEGHWTGNDPCISWFSPEGNQHGPNTLNQLDIQLKLFRRRTTDPVDVVNQVAGDFSRYRMLSDPVLLEEQQRVMAVLSALTEVVGMVNQHVNAPSGVRPPTPPEPQPPAAPTLTGPTHALPGGATNTGTPRANLGVVDEGNNIRPVTPRPQQQTSPAAAPPDLQQQRQKIAVGGGAPPADNDIKMAKRPRTPKPDFERNPRPPSAKDVLQGPGTISDQVDDLDRVAVSSDKSKKGSKNPDERQQIAAAGKDQEADGVQTWAQTHPASTSVYPNAEFPPEIRAVYPKVKGAPTSGPDAIAIDPVAREITSMDITSKPTPEHVAKTYRDGNLLKNKLPERFKGYKVYVQEGWYDGGLQFSPRKPI